MRFALLHILYLSNLSTCTFALSVFQYEQRAANLNICLRLVLKACLNSGTLSQFRNLVPIQEPCPNSGTLSQFRKFVQNSETRTLPVRLMNSTTKPSLPFKKRLQFIPFPSYLPFHHPPSSPLISYINKYFFLIYKKFNLLFP